MNPIEELILNFQNLVAQVPELVQPFIVLLAGAVPFIEGEGAAIIGVVGGIFPITAAIAAAAGNFLSVLIVVLVSSRARTAVLTRRTPHTTASVGGGAVTTLEAPPVKEESKGRVRFRKWLDRFGVPSRISSFVLPLGYSFNLDGSMMYMTFASLFIAQAYGIHLDLGTQVAMLLTLMITSKGIAGVPRASLVVIAATLGQFKLPEAGLLLVLAVDHFLDMGRSATNVIGNAVAASVVARWEGGFDDPQPAEIEPAHAPSHGLSGGH